MSDIIEIDDLDLSVEEIMARIREKIMTRKAEERGIEYPVFIFSRYSREGRGRFRSELYYNLQLANVNYDQIRVRFPIRWRIPIIGPLWALIRRKFHQLVRAYVESMAEKQIAFNAYVVRVLNEMVEALDKPLPPEDIAALRDEVSALRQRVERLEERLAIEEGDENG